MNTRFKTICVCGLILFAAVMFERASAAPSAGFTYQGQLKYDDRPVNGEGRFSFTLWDAETAGRQIGPVVETRTQIINGLFTAQLDFGPGAFRGEPRWLEIYVATTQMEALLSPRQPITPAPFALYALDGPGGGGTLALPFAGTNTTDETGIAVTNSGSAPAAAFATDNASNAQAAVVATTAGSGAGLFAMTGGTGPAVWGLTGDGGGNAGLFKVQGATATQVTLGAENTALGSAGHFKTTKRENTSPALVTETFSDGPAATFTTHSDPNNVNLAPTVTAENDSFGRAGEFAVNNNQSTSDALHASTNGGGSAVHGSTNGTGRAGYFEVDNFGQRSVPALEVVSNGRGAGAGFFKTSSALNTAAALAAESNGAADAVFGTARGLGAAVKGYNALGGSAVVGIVEGATGKAGSFKTTEATNREPAVEAVTDGTGAAGFFENTQLGGQPIAVHAKANGASGWAGYFEGRGYFSKPIGINVKEPVAQLEIASAGVPNQDLLKVGDVMSVSPGGWVAVSGPVTTDRVIYTEPRKGYYSVSFADFSASLLTTERSDAGIKRSIGADGVAPYARLHDCNLGQMVAPVHLPHGATIRTLTVFLSDPSMVGDLDVTLFYSNPATANRLALAGVSTEGERGYQRLSVPVVPSPVVDNANAIYYLVAFGQINRDGLLCDGWGQTFEVTAAIIEYTTREGQ